MNNANLINQDSGIFEYYTPKNIIEAARKTLGTIDLDPASSEKANSVINATLAYGTDGLDKVWRGNVWMNHPFSRENNPLWINKLVDEYNYGAVNQACCITYASTSEKWFQPLFNFPICFLSPRINYYLPDGTLKKGVTKGSCVTYMGDNVLEFIIAFRELGRIVEPTEELLHELLAEGL